MIRVDSVLLPVDERLHFGYLTRVRQELPDGNTSTWLVQSEVTKQIVRCSDKEWSDWLEEDKPHWGTQEQQRRANQQELNALKSYGTIESHKGNRHNLIMPAMAARAITKLCTDTALARLVRFIEREPGSTRKDDLAGLPERIPNTLPEDGPKPNYGLSGTGLGDQIPEEEKEYKIWRVDSVRFDR